MAASQSASSIFARIQLDPYTALQQENTRDLVLRPFVPHTKAKRTDVTNYFSAVEFKFTLSSLR